MVIERLKDLFRRDNDAGHFHQLQIPLTCLTLYSPKRLGLAQSKALHNRAFGSLDQFSVLKRSSKFRNLVPARLELGKPSGSQQNRRMQITGFRRLH